MGTPLPRAASFFLVYSLSRYRCQNLEEINVLRITLDTQIEDLEQHFETAHINYLQVNMEGCVLQRVHCVHFDVS